MLRRCCRLVPIQRRYATSPVLQVATLRKPYQRSPKLITIGSVAVIGVGCYYTIDPFRHVVQAVERCARAGAVGVVLGIDYKLTLSRQYASEGEKELAKKACHKRSAERVREALTKNGGIYIKLGQHVAAMVYLLPPEWTTTMEPLQDRCPATSQADVEKLFLTDMHAPLDQICSEFDPEPIGVASLAQVHRATLRSTGQKVAIKIQHPYLDEFSVIDMKTVEIIIKTVKRIFPDFGFEWLADEMKESLPQELDFVREAKNAKTVQENFFGPNARPESKKRALKIPDIIWAKRRILCMEFIDGDRLDNFEYLQKHNIDPNAISSELSRIFAEMIHIHGFVHCDPHPGNILIRPKTPDTRSSKNFEIVLLDHGLYRTLTEKLRLDYSHLWIALINGKEKDIEKYSRLVGGTEAYRVFACIMTGRTWDTISGADLSSIRSQDEVDKIAEGAFSFLFEVADLLSKMPRLVLLLLKTNDLLRSVDELLRKATKDTHGNGTGHKTYVILGQYCARALYEDCQQRTQSLSAISRWFSISNWICWLECWWNYRLLQRFLQLYEIYLDLKRQHWHDYYSEWREQRTHAALLPVTTAAVQLLDAKGLEWADQSVQLKGVENALGALLNQPENAEGKRQVEEVVFPILAACYFSAGDAVPRRHCLTSLDYCHRTCPSSHVFDDIFAAFIQGQDWIPAQRDAQKAFAIYNCLDFAFGMQVVEKQALDSGRFLSERLHTACDHFQGLDVVPSSVDSIELNQRMDDIRMLLKTLLSLLTRFGGQFQPIIQEVYANRSRTGWIEPLLQDCIHLLDNTQVYAKECSQLAGQIVASLYDLSASSQQVGGRVFSTFFLQESSIEFGLTIPVTLIGLPGWSADDAPVLSLVRGLLTNLQDSILLAQVQVKKQTLSHIDLPVSSMASGRYTLLKFLLLAVCRICDNHNLDQQTKVLAFESVSICLSRSTGIFHIDKHGVDGDGEALLEDMLPADMINVLLNYVWDYWDDPIEAMQHKVRSIFGELLKLLETKARLLERQGDYIEFLQGLAARLLQMDRYRKVKYALLHILLPKIGTNIFFRVQPNFIARMASVFTDSGFATKVSLLLVSFLTLRLEELIPKTPKAMPDNSGTEKKNKKDKMTLQDPADPDVIAAWKALWIKPIAQAMVTEDVDVCKHIAQFLLPELFNLVPSSYTSLLSAIASQKHSNVLHATISTLKVGKSMDLEQEKGQEQVWASSFDIQAAAESIDPQLRIDALGLVCESHKSTAEITTEQLDFVKSFLILNMNCTSPEFRQKFYSSMQRFLTRLRANLFVYIKDKDSSTAHAKGVKDNKVDGDINKVNESLNRTQEKIAMVEKWLNWFIDFLMASIYPGASYQRVATALRMFALLISLFGSTELPMPVGFDHKPVLPFKIPIFTGRNVKLLISTLANPFDHNRQQAYDILSGFPAPFPEVDSVESVQDLLHWALHLMKGGRAGESESGAFIFRLVYTKYVVGCNMPLQVHKGEKGKYSDGAVEDVAPIAFARRLLDFVEFHINEARTDMLKAAEHHPMHGILSATAYLFRGIDYRDSLVLDHLDEWRTLHRRAIRLVDEAASAVMEILSNPSPEGNVPSSFREMEEAIDALIDDEGGAGSTDRGPKHQVILSFAWRAVKEASTLLGVICDRAPLKVADQGADVAAFLEVKDVLAAGAMFKRWLTSIRHRGAFSSVYPNYVALCSRLLSSPAAQYRSLPKTWIKDDIQSICAASLSVTRRSAGLPFCILAIVSSGPGNRKPLLNVTMEELVEIASQQMALDADQKTDAPQIHAFNILRQIFMDAKLGLDVLPFVADAFKLAVDGFASNSWAIRNCSVMLFSALVQRTFGSKKNKDHQNLPNTLTAREFFSRFPSLHPYLLKELELAVQQFKDERHGISVHPKLFPLLTLLSRLHPSIMEGAENTHTMKPFVPLVRLCSASVIQKTREMAARALVPLIPSSQVVNTSLEILAQCELDNQNQLHGNLLQVQYLLQGHLYSIATDEILSEFVQSANSIFVAKWKIATEENPSLRVEANAHFTPIKQLATDMAESVLMVTPDISTYQIAGYRVSEQLADILLHSISTPLGKTAQGGQDHQAVSAVLRLLSSEEYEVRTIALKRLLDMQLRNDLSDSQSIKSKLIFMIYSQERNLECLRLACRLLTKLHNQAWPDEANVPLENFWIKVVSDIDANSQPAIETHLPLLGALLASMEGDPMVKRHMRTWSSYIVRYSHQDLSLPCREACVHSLRWIASVIFQHPDPEQDQVLVSILFTIIRLLQDDDVDVRNDMAAIVSHALAIKGVVLPERAVELVYTYTVQHYPHSSYFHSLLLERLYGEDTLESIRDQELSPSRILFERENPNIYREELVDVQISAQCIALVIQVETPVYNGNGYDEKAYAQRPGALAALDDTANSKLTWRQYRTVLISSTGFFMDSYDLFVIGLIVPMLGYIYYQPSNTVPANISGPLKGIANVGNLIGQLLFGFLGDAIGRHKIYGFELLIIIISTFGCAMAGSAAAGVGAVGFLGFWRLLMGIGIGGDYPMSATVTSEWATAGRRGQMLALTFSMQGWGQLAGGIIDIILLAIFKGAIDANPLNLDYVWRILAAMGCVPALATLYYRFALPESPRYAVNVLKDEEAARIGLKYVDVVDYESDKSADVTHPNPDISAAVQRREHFKEFCAYFAIWKNGKVLMGTALSWFLLDIAFYGLTLNTPVVLSAIGFAPKGLSPWETLWKQAIGNIIIVCLGSLPGYYATVFLVERIGRKTIQLIGFIMNTILFVIIAAAYEPLSNNALPAFIVLFVLVQFFFQFGANATTFIIPAEVYPTRFRATAHGFSAASGKAGAIIAAFGFNSLINVGGTNAFLAQTLGIFAALMFLGILTTLPIPEPAHKSLDYFEDPEVERVVTHVHGHDV
ncbi:hypothetical protein BZG36_02864 [Bifiguratus adelaidae]|uniref:Major facilitator superfamily (MFS) profile domain-containing protein n=1 Tax=Bifiguratus adelaidae TaxID=1938954 RepID=A0A261Y0H2_9FUNG|nr:hypothetical protein BZG36_02864 [Bifiguratus adelaidae]